LLFDEYKLAGPGFAHGGFQGYLQDLIANGAVSFYRPVLSGIVLPHPVVLGYLVGLVETSVGMSLLLGLWVRPASVLGALFLLNLTLAGWWEPVYGVPVRRYFGAELDPLPRLLLFIIFFFFAADAGPVGGWDGRRG
jgi:uncharacterized membrane protein YphA (DoxX/SURF4 family)